MYVFMCVSTYVHDAFCLYENMMRNPTSFSSLIRMVFELKHQMVHIWDIQKTVKFFISLVFLLSVSIQKTKTASRPPFMELMKIWWQPRSQPPHMLMAAGLVITEVLAMKQGEVHDHCTRV